MNFQNPLAHVRLKQMLSKPGLIFWKILGFFSGQMQKITTSRSSM